MYFIPRYILTLRLISGRVLPPTLVRWCKLAKWLPPSKKSLCVYLLRLHDLFLLPTRCRAWPL